MMVKDVGDAEAERTVVLQTGRGRHPPESAWAGSLWTAAHDVRWEALHRDPPVSRDAVHAQAAQRLRRANA